MFVCLIHANVGGRGECVRLSWGGQRHINMRGQLACLHACKRTDQCRAWESKSCYLVDFDNDGGLFSFFYHSTPMCDELNPRLHRFVSPPLFFLLPHHFPSANACWGCLLSYDRAVGNNGKPPIMGVSPFFSFSFSFSFSLSYSSHIKHKKTCGASCDNQPL